MAKVRIPDGVRGAGTMVRRKLTNVYHSDSNVFYAQCILNGTEYNVCLPDPSRSIWTVLTTVEAANKHAEYLLESGQWDTDYRKNRHYLPDIPANVETPWFIEIYRTAA